MSEEMTAESPGVQLLGAYYGDDPGAVERALFQAKTLHDANQRAKRLDACFERLCAARTAAIERELRVKVLKEALGCVWHDGAALTADRIKKLIAVAEASDGERQSTP